MKFRLLAAAATLCMALPLVAHHSLANYDSAHPVSVTGTVTTFQWRNAHVLIQLSVKNPDGTVTEKRVQLGGVMKG